MEAAVRANLNEGATECCCSAEVARPLIGYFQLLLMTLLDLLLCAKMLKSKRELSLLFQALPDSLLVFTLRGEVSPGQSEIRGVKTGEADSPCYCSLRPLMRAGCFPESVLCTYTCTQVLKHYCIQAAAKNKLTTCLFPAKHTHRDKVNSE